MRFSSRLNQSVVLKRDNSGISQGSGLGEGLSLIGRAAKNIGNQQFQMAEAEKDSAFRIEQREVERQRAAHVADRVGAWAATQADIATGLNELRQRSKPGAEGYEEEAQSLIRERLEGFADTLNLDEEVQNRFAPIVQGYAARTIAGEQAWAGQARVEWQGENIEAWQNQSVGRIYDEPTPENLESYFAETELIFDASDLDGNGKAAGKWAAKAEGVKTLLDGMIAKGDWRGADALLASGNFDAYLDAGRNEKQTYAGRVGNAQAVEAREAAIAESSQRDKVRDEIKSAELRIEAGEIPDQAEMRALTTAAEQAGLDKSELTELALLDEDIAVNRAYRGKSAAEINRDLNSVRSRVASGAASAGEQRSVSDLERLVKARNKQESEQYKELLKSGVQGRMQILTQLPKDPEVRFAQAENVEGGLGHIALLGPRSAGLALEGRELRKARPKDFGEKDEIHKAALRALGPVAAQLGGDFDDISGVAADIYAGSMNALGRAGFNEKEYAAALSIALGATSRSAGGPVQGGLGTVRGKQVLLPDNRTAAEFDVILSRHDFADAIYGDRTRAQKSDILGRFRPEYIGDNDRGQPGYVFVAPNGRRLKRTNRTDYILRILR